MIRKSQFWTTSRVETSSCITRVQASSRNRIRPVGPTGNVDQVAIVLLCPPCHGVAAALLVELAPPPLVELLLLRPALQPGRVEQLPAPDPLVERRDRAAEPEEHDDDDARGAEALEAVVADVAAQNAQRLAVDSAREDKRPEADVEGARRPGPQRGECLDQEERGQAQEGEGEDDAEPVDAFGDGADRWGRHGRLWSPLERVVVLADVCGESDCQVLDGVCAHARGSDGEETADDRVARG